MHEKLRVKKRRPLPELPLAGLTWRYAHLTEHHQVARARRQRVITVSLETMKIVRSLSPLDI